MSEQGGPVALSEEGAILLDEAGAAWADWYPEDRTIAYDDNHFESFMAGYLAGRRDAALSEEEL